jgi:hypothetical protein
LQADKHVQLHCWFDSNQYSVKSVSSHNPYGAGNDYVFFSQEIEPGLLAITLTPTKGSTAAAANGDCAVVELQPASTRQISQDVPNGRTSYGSVIWYKGPNLTTSGTIYSGFDGPLGDPTRDGTSGHPNGLLGENTDSLTQDGIPSPTDLTLFDATCTGYGSVYYVAQDNSIPVTVSWTERLPGDYDNNGLVDLSDTVPIGELWTPNSTSSPAYAQGAVTVNIYNQTSFLNLHDKMMTYHAGLDFDQNWYATDHNLYSYFYLDGTWASPSDPPAFSPDYSSFGDGFGKTNRNNAVDGFMDGFIRQWKNYADGVDDPLQPIDVYEVPGLNQWAPGDTLPMHLHFDERIDGYEVTTQLDSVAEPEYTVKRFYRDSDLIGTDSYGVVYPDRPWENYQGNLSNEDWRKAVLSLDMTKADFHFPAHEGVGYSGAYYNVNIRPFIQHTAGDPSSLEYGTTTTLKDVLQYVPPGDDWGPQYRVAQTPPGYSGDLRGLFEAAQDTDPNKTTFVNLSYFDADDLDANGNWHEDGVSYSLYGMSQDTQPTASELFSYSHYLTRWYEPDSASQRDPGNADVWHRGVNLAPYINGLFAWPNPSKHFWFGIRAYEAYGPGQWTIEYAPSDQTLQTPNQNIVGVTPIDTYPPYFFSRDYTFSPNRAPEDAGSFEENSYGLTDRVRIYCEPAIDPPFYSQTDQFTYTLYYDDASFATTPAGLAGIPASQQQTIGPFTYNDLAASKFSQLQFDITSLDGGVGLQQGQPIWYFVRAKLVNNNNPLTGATQFSETLNNTLWKPNPNSIPIVTNLQKGEAQVAGDLQTIGDYVYLLHPDHKADAGSLFGDYTECDLSVKRLTTSGLPQTSPAGVYEHLLAGAADGPIYNHQASLSFALDPTSFDYATGSGDWLKPLVSYSANNTSQSAYFPSLPHTAEYTGSAWLLTDHDQYPQQPLTPHSDAVNVFSFRYNSNNALTGTYFLPWVKETYPTIDTSGSAETGSLIYRYRSPALASWLPSIGSPLTIDSIGYVQADFPYVTRCPDVIVRDVWQESQLAPATTDPHVQGGGGQSNAAGNNHLYVLASCPHETKAVWDKLTLWRIDSLPGAAAGVDLRSAWSSLTLPDGSNWLRSGVGAADCGGPDAMTVLGSQSSSTNTVCVAFPNSKRGEHPPGSTNRGLRLAWALDSGAAPSSWSWSTAGNLGLIDPDYIAPNFPDSVGTIAPTIHDVIDLRGKPGTSGLSGLGCAYRDRRNKLVLSEDSTGQWIRRVIDPGDFIPSLDSGYILWVKLAYDKNGHPNVLYARSKTGNNGSYDIMLWHGN